MGRTRGGEEPMAESHPAPINLEETTGSTHDPPLPAHQPVRGVVQALKEVGHHVAGGAAATPAADSQLQGCTGFE